MEIDGVTVVIPSYKSEGFIKKSVVSVLSQSLPNVEVIVVEDGTFDETASIVKELMECNPGIIKHIVNEKNIGAAASRNRGLEKVKTKYVLFLDADDCVNCDLISGLVDKLEVSGCSLAIGPCKKIDSKGHLVSFFYPPFSESPDELIKRWLLGESGPNPSAVLWRTGEIKRIGGWREDIGLNDDGELMIRAMLEDCTLSSSSQGYGVYLQHDGYRLSKDRSDRGYASIRKIVDYVEAKIRSDERFFSSLMSALVFYKANIAIDAYIYKDRKVASQWEDEWKRAGGSWRSIPIASKKALLYKVLIFLLGLKGTACFIERLRVIRRIG